MQRSVVCLAGLCVLGGTVDSVALNAQVGARPRAVGSRRVSIPRTWDSNAIAGVMLPLADRSASPVPVSSDYYYRMPVRRIYRSYPIYAPGREPPGYLESLRQKLPEVVFDAGALRTDADWVRAGELVFDAPIAFDNEPLEIARFDLVRDTAWYRQTGVSVTRDGIMPYARYVIRKTGVVEVGSLACSMCHTRIMPDGSMIKGAQGNFPFDRAIAALLRGRVARTRDTLAVLNEERAAQRMLFAAPWRRRPALPGPQRPRTASRRG